MNINPHDEALKCIKSIEKRLAEFMVDETKLKQSVANTEKSSDKSVIYDRLKQVQNTIFKHQTYLFAAYSKLQSIDHPAPLEPDPDVKPFGIGELKSINVPTP